MTPSAVTMVCRLIPGILLVFAGTPTNTGIREASTPEELSDGNAGQIGRDELDEIEPNTD